MLYFASSLPYFLRPHRLTVRTQAFQAWNPGSIPGGVMKLKTQTALRFRAFMTTTAMFSVSENREGRPASARNMGDERFVGTT